MNIIYRMFTYDFLYITGDQLIKKHNPCQVQLSMDGLVECVDDIEVCCRGCEHLGYRGCKVNSLWCKLYICNRAEISQPSLSYRQYMATRLRDMKMVAVRYSLNKFRASRQFTYTSLRKRRNWKRSLQ